MRMILTNEELECARREMHNLLDRINDYRKHLKEQEGLDASQVQRAVDPIEVLLEEHVGDVNKYILLKSGAIPEVDITRLGFLVVCCRIASGKTQEEFAQMQGILAEQVVKNEHNGYFGTSPADIQRLFEMLGYEIKPVTRYAVKKL